MAETIASLAVRIGADLSGFEKSMKEFNKTWGKLGQQVSQAGQQIGTTFTAAGGAIAAGLGLAVNKAMDFDSQMSRVSAISQATESDFQALRQTALDLGASTSKSATEVAQGMELMAAKGYDAQQVIAAMPGVIAAAEASGEDMALVADTVSSALNAWGMEASEASHVADVLAQSANSSAAGVEDLQYSFKYAAPMAKQLGITMEELAAATGIMADAGMKGEQAGTTLRMAFIRLADPPKEARAALENLGITVTDANGKFLPMIEIIRQFQQKLSGLSDAQKIAAMSTIFGAEAASGMLNVIDAGPKKFSELVVGLANADGQAKKTADVMKDNLKGSLQELSGAAETAQISIGGALSPAITVLADGLSGLVNWFNQLSPGTQKFIAIGAALVAILFLVVGALGFVAAGLGVLVTLEWAAILPILAMVGAFLLIIAVVAVVVAVIINYWDEIVKYLGIAWQWLKDTAVGVWESIKQTAIIVWEALKAFFVGLWNSIVQITTTIWNGIVSFFQGAWDRIVGIFQAVWNVIGPLILMGWENIKTIFTTYLQTIWTVIQAGWEIIKTIFATAFLFIYYLVTGQWDKIGQLFTAAWEKIKGIVLGLWENIKSIWTSAFEAVKARTEFMWEYVKQLFVKALVSIVMWVYNKWQEIKQKFIDAGESVKQTVSNMWNNVVGFFKSAPGKILTALIDLKERIMGKWREMKSDALSMGKNMIEGFINGITSMAGKLAQKAKEVVKAAVDGAKAFLGIHSPSRLWEKEIGEMTGKGAIIGMENTIADVSKMGSLLGESTIPDNQYYPSRAITNSTSDSNDSFNFSELIDALIAFAGRDIVVMIDGKAVVRATAKDMDAELQRIKKDNNRGRGIFT